MALYYYLKGGRQVKTGYEQLTGGVFKKSTNLRLTLRFLSIFLFSFGIGLLSWLAWPFLEWKLIYAPQFDDVEIIRPIPSARAEVKSDGVVANENLIYASNWFPQAPPQVVSKDALSYYNLSIPKLGIKGSKAIIGGEDLSKSLIYWGGTALPGKNGTGVVFGHSVLPQFFNPKNLMSIFSTIHTLKKGDEIIIDADGVEYKYQVFGFEIVEPEDTSFLDQKYDDAYLYLITCTPPGTYLKRLVVKSRLRKL